jgi:hypothetical protein
MEFNVRIDFFRDLEDGPKGLRRVRCATASGRCATASGRWCCPEWASMSTDSARPACGMDLRDIPARPTVASPPSSMAPVPAFKADPTRATEQQPTVTVVVRALWPGDGPLAGERRLRDYDQKSWKLQFFSDNTPSQAFLGQPLM